MARVAVATPVVAAMLAVEVAGAAAGGPVPGPEPRLPPPVTATAAASPPELVSVRSLGTGRRVPGAMIRPSRPAGRGGGMVVFDTLTSPNSTAHLNVAYLNPGSYDGSDPSTTAIVLPMADRLAQHAPFDAAAGLPVPTDIVWNEYHCDARVWPGGAASTHSLRQLALVCFISNVVGPGGHGSPRYRMDRLQVRFFTTDGLTDLGGVEVVYNSPPYFASYFAQEVDLTEVSPPIRIPRDGLVMLDWVGESLDGVGSMLAGGDLISQEFPRPEALVTMGTTDPETMAWADGVIGSGGYPNFLDPGYDGDPSSTSYLDVLNGGEIANWNIHLGDPAFRIFCRDFPCRLVIDSGEPTCACDMDASGFVNSQDFFDFLVAFFSGEADFNMSGATDSQDFFDFLVCFFVGC